MLYNLHTVSCMMIFSGRNGGAIFIRGVSTEHTVVLLTAVAGSTYYFAASQPAPSLPASQTVQAESLSPILLAAISGQEDQPLPELLALPSH